MVKLRKYLPGDENKVLTLVTNVLSEYSLRIDPDGTDSDLKNIDISYFKDGGVFKVLVENELIIGSYGLYNIDNVNCELRKMYLNSAYRRKGLGRLMMENAFKTAVSSGFKRMTLETNSVLKEAIELYKRYGFKEYKPGHISCRCDIAMEKEIV